MSVAKSLSFALSVWVLAACAVSPTGRQQFMVLSATQLDAMGIQAFSELKSSKPTETNPRISAYVRCVARAITQEAGTPGPWEVVVFKDRSANAFALPGGKIGVNTGLLEVAENQDQLAAVLGHEVAHVLANHANERLSQELGVQVGLGALGSVAGNPNSVSQQSIMKVLGLGAQLGILLPFSRVHETEADVIGLDLMARAGFDPRQSLALWRNMARAGGSQPPEFLSTHPSYGSRTQELEKNMGKAWQTYEAARARGKYPRCN